MTTAVTISVNSHGRERVLPAAPDLGAEVGRLLRRYADASDVTVTIELAHSHGQLLVALEAGSVFVGLFTADGTYQYVADEQAEGRCQFVIGCAPTLIDRRYVMQLPAAVDLLTPWIGGDPPLSAPGWERR